MFGRVLFNGVSDLVVDGTKSPEEIVVEIAAAIAKRQDAKDVNDG